MSELSNLCQQTLPAIESRLTEGMNDLTPIPVVEAISQFGLELRDEVDWEALRTSLPIIAPKLIRVMEECAVNARRHGGASSLRVFVTYADGCIALNCHDNGSGVPSKLAKGLGSRLFDEICAAHQGHWSLKRIESVTEFSMSLRE